MADERLAAVTYVGLPISSGGAHGLGRMSRVDAHRRVASFLRTCAEPLELTYSFWIHDVPELPADPRYEHALRSGFGDYRRVGSERVPEALAFMDEIDPQPTNRWGLEPIWFTLTSKFLVLDPASDLPIPGQDPRRYGGVEYEPSIALGTSRLRLRLGNRQRLAIELCLPFPDEAALHRVVPWLQTHLPFRFSDKQWRAWTPTRTGSFKGRKFAMSKVLPPDR